MIPDNPASVPRHDFPARRQRAAETRERIIVAAAEIARGLATFEWRELTFRAVAERSGVAERTVYRHFPSERQLHDAVIRRLEDDAGIDYESTDLDNIAEVTARVLAALHRFARPDVVPIPDDPTLVSADERRQQALMRAVSARAAGWSERERRIAAGLLDALWSPVFYERLVRTWKLDAADAAAGLTWLIGKVVASVDDDEAPSAFGGGGV
jgi:AcrR family transcriptional regulator